jgi:hypothetical protein
MILPLISKTLTLGVEDIEIILRDLLVITKLIKNK